MRTNDKDVLTKSYEFLVFEANYSTVPHTSSNDIDGSGFRSSMVGSSSNVSLKVKPILNDIPIKVLYFHGYTHIETGDRIRATVPKYHESKEEVYFSDELEEEHETEYVERDHLEEETASRLEKMSTDGKRVLASFE